MPREISKDLFVEEARTGVLEKLRPYFASGAEEIFHKSSLIYYLKGEEVLKQGEEGSDMYILISGSLSAFISKDEKETEVGFVIAGECIGEMALLGDNVRSASVVTRRNSLLLKVSDHSFREVNTLQKGEPSIQLSKVLIERLKRSNERINTPQKHSKFIALVDVNGHMDSDAFVESFKSYWEGNRSVALIKASELRSMDELEIAILINKLEAKEYVLLTASDAEDMKRINALSDKTVYFASEVDHKKFESLNINVLDHDELIIAYPDQPKNLDSWLTHFSAEKVFKFKLGDQEHLERVIRVISETAICLVLGGGGAHGLSILGVVKALQEKNIPIDMICGTSIGSIMGSAFAMNWPYQEIYSKVESDISKKNPLTDYTWPFVSIIKGNKMKKVLRKHFNTNIELSWKNLLIVASNLSKAKTEVISTGPMDLSIASSIAIPGILPPQLYRKSLLIDGGVLNNLPTDIARNKFKGHVISVDVVSNKKRTIEHKYKLSNWQLFKNILTGSNKNYVPNTMSTLMKAVTLASTERAHIKEAMSDIYLKPRIKKGFLAWKEMDAFVSEGYLTTIDALSDHNYKDLLSLPR